MLKNPKCSLFVNRGIVLSTLEKKLESGAKVLLDGALGTEIASRGFDATLPLYTAQALLKDPDLVRSIHADYIEAGAEVLIANTFCTSEIALASVGLEKHRDDLPELAVQLALEAVEMAGKSEEVTVAAALAPLSSFFTGKNPSEEQLQETQEEHAARLALAGVDVVFCETMTSVKEARSAVLAAKASGLQTIISLVPSDTRHLSSGETLDTAVRSLIKYQPLAFCLNCCPLEIMDTAISSILSLAQCPVGAYASSSSFQFNHDSPVDSGISSLQYLRHAQRWMDLGVQLIGGCCGTTPKHIELLKKKLNFGTIGTKEKF